jgi:glycosyltransferase involved in cell wall biosynthesis
MLQEATTGDVSLATVAVLIPCWQPGAELAPLVAALLSYGFGQMVVVADGEPTDPIFAELAQMVGVQVLRHAVNLGKGRALKTGFQAVLANLPQVETVVTADADGQHLVVDIVAVAREAMVTQLPVLGTRRFSVRVPIRSRVGNGFTRALFLGVTGTMMADTQTGLRAVPRVLLPELLELPGERYEYETSMLAYMCRDGRRPVEVPISTVYLDGNRSSHFDPLWDSMRISFVLLRFYSSSLIASAMDFLGFAIVFAASGNLALGVAAGRLSSLVNLALNRRYVFQNRSQITPVMVRYYVIASGIAVMSYLIIRAAMVHLHWNVYAAKVAADVLLSLLSFSVQSAFVFIRPKKNTTTSRRAASVR